MELKGINRRLCPKPIWSSVTVRALDVDDKRSTPSIVEKDVRDRFHKMFVIQLAPLLDESLLPRSTTDRYVPVDLQNEERQKYDEELASMGSSRDADQLRLLGAACGVQKMRALSHVVQREAIGRSIVIVRTQAMAMVRPPHY